MAKRKQPEADSVDTNSKAAEGENIVRASQGGTH